MRLVPKQVGCGAFGNLTLVMTACGFEHTLVVTHGGTVWATIRCHS